VDIGPIYRVIIIALDRPVRCSFYFDRLFHCSLLVKNFDRFVPCSLARNCSFLIALLAVRFNLIVCSTVRPVRHLLADRFCSLPCSLLIALLAVRSNLIVCSTVRPVRYLLVDRPHFPVRH
jgi:hypothetical protein